MLVKDTTQLQDFLASQCGLSEPISFYQYNAYREDPNLGVTDDDILISLMPDATEMFQKAWTIVSERSSEPRISFESLLFVMLRNQSSEFCVAMSKVFDAETILKLSLR